MNLKNEHYLALLGFRFGPFWFARGYFPKEGTPSSVEFRWQRVLFNQRLIGFYHTHPSGFSAYSTTDHTTMDSWVIALGRPLLCLIQPEGDSIKSWKFIEDSDPKIGKAFCWKKIFWGIN